jgi:hypothetical protein
MFVRYMIITNIYKLDSELFHLKYLNEQYNDIFLFGDT